MRQMESRHDDVSDYISMKCGMKLFIHPLQSGDEITYPFSNFNGTSNLPHT